MKIKNESMLYRNLFPLKPFPVGKVWGGGHLDRFKDAAEPNSVGEWVLFSNLELFPVQVQVNVDQFTDLNVFWSQQRFADDFPFMLKILSTSEPLSLQNHPADEDIEKLNLSGRGKFECWVMLEADSDSRAYLGLKDTSNSNQLTQLDEHPDPLSLFNAYALHTGDVVRLDPGLVHGTQGKMLFYEIQQPSDHTFRIHDFGRGRSLHLKEAATVFRQNEIQISNWNTPLVTDAFSLQILPLKDRALNMLTPTSFSVLTWIGDAAVLTNDEDIKSEKNNFRLEISWGDSFVVFGEQKLRIELNSHNTIQKDSSKLPIANRLFIATKETK